MSLLVITHRQKDFWVRIPYQVIVNGRLVGTMNTPQARLRLPAGYYTITIRSGSYVPIGKKGKTLDLTLSSTAPVQVSEYGYTCLDFKNKERWWNTLFNIDLILWLTSVFLRIPNPWNIVCHVVSEGFFLIWIIRLLIVRRRYYSMESYFTSEPPEAVYPKKTRMERYVEEHQDEIQARQRKIYDWQQDRLLKRMRHRYKFQEWWKKHLKRRC